MLEDTSLLGSGAPGTQDFSEKPEVRNLESVGGLSALDQDYLEFLEVLFGVSLGSIGVSIYCPCKVYLGFLRPEYCFGSKCNVALGISILLSKLAIFSKEFQ